MPRAIRPLLVAATLAAAIATALLPSAAHAQFGGLKRRLEAEMSKAVRGEESASSAAPRFDDRVLEITDARLAQLVKGLRVEGAAAERESRDEAARAAKEAEREKALEAYGRCTDPYSKELLRYMGMTMGLTLAAKREQDRDGKASRTVEDSLKAVTARMTKTKETMQAKCGDEPGESPFASMSEQEGADPETAGARAAGLTADQYAVLRERVAAFLRATDGRTGRYAFTAAERAALGARSAELGAVRKQLLGD